MTMNARKQAEFPLPSGKSLHADYILYFEVIFVIPFPLPSGKSLHADLVAAARGDTITTLFPLPSGKSLHADGTRKRGKPGVSTGFHCPQANLLGSSQDICFLRNGS